MSTTTESASKKEAWINAAVAQQPSQLWMRSNGGTVVEFTDKEPTDNGWSPVFAALATQQSEAQTCTCPSGDGSLRWPCPEHPPEAAALKIPVSVADWEGSLHIVEADGTPTYVSMPKGWSTNPKLMDLVRRINAQQSEACEINQFSSRMCEMGTKSCTVEHSDQLAEAGALSDRVLHAIYKCCQRGDSPERLHKAVMELVVEAGAPTAAAEQADFIAAARGFAQAHIDADEMEARDDMDSEAVADHEYQAKHDAYNRTKADLLRTYRMLLAVPTSGRESAAPLAQQDAKDVAAKIVRDVCELDYTGENWDAEKMLSVTVEDLGLIAERAIDAAMQKGAGNV